MTFEERCRLQVYHLQIVTGWSEGRCENARRKLFGMTDGRLDRMARIGKTVEDRAAASWEVQRRTAERKGEQFPPPHIATGEWLHAIG